MSISSVELGQRLVELRKAKGLSQDELAKQIGIARSALTLVELGKRSLDAFELYRLSAVLGFSIDYILSAGYTFVGVEDKEEEDMQEKIARISVPELNTKKLKQVLLYVLERCAGKSNVGEAVLNKLLYFIDFNYFELFETHLTGARYIKLPYGPVPQRLDVLISRMVEAGEVARIKTEYHKYQQTRFLPLMKPDLTLLLASEKDVIDRVVDQMSDWSAATISEYSHGDMPWLATRDGEEIDYELAFYRGAPFSVRNYAEDAEA